MVLRVLAYVRSCRVSSAYAALGEPERSGAPAHDGAMRSCRCPRRERPCYATRHNGRPQRQPLPFRGLLTWIIHEWCLPRDRPLGIGRCPRRRRAGSVPARMRDVPVQYPGERCGPPPDAPVHLFIDPRWVRGGAGIARPAGQRWGRSIHLAGYGRWQQCRTPVARAWGSVAISRGIGRPRDPHCRPRDPARPAPSAAPHDFASPVCSTSPLYWMICVHG